MKRGSKVGFAVVGLGAIAQGSVLPAFRHAKQAKLVALVSRDKRKAEELRRKFKAKSCYAAEEFGKCLANPEVEAVYLATPPSEHLSATLAAARAGKHVLCEKPLALNAAQSAEMIRVCEQHGVQLMTAYRKYYEPSTLYLKKLIHSGRRKFTFPLAVGEHPCEKFNGVFAVRIRKNRLKVQPLFVNLPSQTSHSHTWPRSGTAT